MPFQSEKQRRFLHANHPEIAKRWEKEYANGGISNHFRKKLSEGSEDSYGQLLDDWDAGLIIDALPGEDFTTYYNRIMKVENDTGTEEVESLNLLAENQDPLNLSQGVTTLFQAKNGGMTIQGGVDNWLGEQKTVSGVPIKWKSQPGAPETELAYITKAEKDLILKTDLHGSLKDGPNLGPNGVMSLDSAGGSYGSPGSGTGRDSPGGAGYGDGPKDPVAPPAVRQKQIKDLIDKADEEKYDSWEQMVQDKYPGQGLTTKTPHFNIQKSKVILGKARDDWNQVKDSMNEKYKKKAGKMIIDGLLGKGVTFGISSIIGMMIDGYKTNKAKQEFISDIKNQIANYKDLGIPEHSPHTDTLIQTLNQELLDLTQKRDKDDVENNEGPVVPITEDIETYEQMADATGQIDMFDAWGDIKQKQALRASLFADEDQAKVGDWVGDQRLLVNSGGLANLFRVKNNQ